MKIKCLKCGDIIENDLKGTMIWCKCGSCFLDGTPSYLRIGGDPKFMEEIKEDGQKGTV